MKVIPNNSYFFWRRMHSLTGALLVIFLIEHLLTNSQAALFFGNDGEGFIRAVNKIKNLPYLPVIEITLIALPILIHLFQGLHYLFTSEPNSYSSDGSKPSLPSYPNNQAYTWQRITSWILVFTLLGHIAHMRFYEYPTTAKIDDDIVWMVRVNKDKGLPTVAERLDIEIYNKKKIAEQENLWKTTDNVPYKNEVEKQLLEQKMAQEEEWLKAIKKRALSTKDVMLVTKNFGTAELMMIRNTFKSPFMIAIYTIFVLSACFHGFNGLWTFMITWGVTITTKAQKAMRLLCMGLTLLIAFLGLITIFGTYWINLRQ